MSEFWKTILGAAVGGGIAAYGAITVAQMEFVNRASEVAVQSRQLDVEMVKLSLSILGGEISDKTAQSRRFALQSLQKYSGIDIPSQDIAAWEQSGTVRPIENAPALWPSGGGGGINPDRIIREMLEERRLQRIPQ